jgi:hypothetical protein
LDDLEKSKKDIEENYELFEKDFNCLEFLAKHSPDEMEISPEEKKILERHFGKYGLDVRTRLGVEPTQDFDQEIRYRVWELYQDWSGREFETGDDALKEIYLHVPTRFHNIYNALERGENLND